MMTGIEMTGIEFAEIVYGARRQSQESEEEFLVIGLFPLGDELLGVIWILEISVSFVGAGVPGDEICFVVEAEPVWVDFHGQAYTGVTGRDQVAVPVKGNAKLRRGLGLSDVPDIVFQGVSF